MVRDLLTLTWEEISSAAPEKWVLFLGVAPVEEHGKHLPVGVDVLLTKRWMEGAAQLLDQDLDNYQIGLLPVIPLGFAEMGNFPGNIHVDRPLIFQAVYQTVRCIAQWGVKNILVISGHADPRHGCTIDQACEKVNQEMGIVAFAPMGRIFRGEQLEYPHQRPSGLEQMEECHPNDFHAGWIETSSMLDIAPELVKDNFSQRPDIVLDGRSMMDSRKVAEAIRGEGHIGYPRKATAALGRALNRDMAFQIKAAALEFVQRSGGAS